MADEFAKGLGVATAGGLIWMVLAGWYRTPSFEGAQLTGEVPSNLTVFDQLAVALMGVAFWFTVVGMLTFWVLIPAARQAYAGLAGE